MNILSTLIKDRKARGIKQSEVAKYIGISNSMLSRIESETSVQNLKYIDKYAEFLGFELRLLKR